MTQEKLAAELGLTKGAVGNWESDANPPGPDTLRKIAALLRTTEDYLSGKTDQIEITVLNDQPGSRFIASPIYGQLQTSTLEKNLIDLARGLSRASAGDRKHLLGNIRAMLDELEDREINPRVSSKSRAEDEELLDDLERGGSGGASKS